ncbi:hypothetical protein TRFO_10261 [Tritrichomonas foetus]|uniref:Importin N-terminal domain-containing protein n=1 Tax=Tritrichomonas foetus TaxID=1144522 RepID=A0A1J4JF27_9EUKA|nr:hypothetical protein TRFO_10261 [Tritrichomonas foetus]|eukprot:OHS95860.1 hypothetical protein TRFO_10261 [Tritrichomonas foetus]
MSEDLAHQLTQCYAILSNPNPYPQKVPEITSFLMDFYSKSDSFVFLINYISNINNEVLQNCAVLGLKQCLQVNGEQLQGIDAFKSLLNLSIFPNSVFVRKNAIFYISKFISPPAVQIILQFIQSLSQSPNEIHLEAAMKLLTILLKIIPEEDLMSIIELCTGLSQLAFQTSSIDVIVSASIFRISFLPFLPPDSPSFQEYVQASIQVLIQLLQQGDSLHTDELVTVLIDFIHANSFSFDCLPLLSTCIQFLVMPDLPVPVAEQILSLTDNILESCQDSIVENPILSEVLKAYIYYAKRTYNPSDTYELSNYLTFSMFFKIFFDDEIILPIYQQIPSLCQESSGKYVSLLILDSSFDFSSDFYTSRIPELFQLLDMTLKDPDLCVKSTASFVLSRFCQVFKPSLNFEPIIHSLVECLNSNQSIEYLTCLTDIFDISAQTDSIFDQCCSYLFQLLNVNDVLFQQKVIICISSLTKHSRERVCVYFHQIFPMMSHVLNSNEESLLSPAIACLYHLCQSCTAQMASFIPTFLNFITGTLNNSVTQFESINALSTIFEYYTEEAKSFVVTALKSLFEISNVEINIDDENDFNFDANDEDDEFFEFQNTINANSAAVRVICKMFSLYPELLLQNYNDAFSILMKFKDHISGDGTLACAKGCIFIATALTKIQNCEPQCLQIINEIILPLMSGSDVETSGNAFLALSIILRKYQNAISPNILEVLSMALNGELFFQRGRVTYNRTLFDGILHLLKSLIKADLIEQIKPFLPIFQNMLQTSKSYRLRDFALEFFGDYCSAFVGILPDEMKVSILQTALSVNDGYSSIDCITKFAKTIPQFISPILPQIIEMIKIRFAENNIIVTEKCIILCSTLLNKCQVDISIFVPIILQSTPPSTLLKRTNIFLELVQFIASANNNELIIPIATSLIKLFSETDSLLKQRCLTNENLIGMKTLLQTLIPAIPDFNNLCIQVCNNDSFRLTNLQAHLENK